MKKAIADTSSIIHPAKVQTFWALMKETFAEILISEAVREEILKGEEFGSSEVPVIKKSITDGWIKVVKVKKLLAISSDLGQGERESISLAMLMMQKQSKEEMNNLWLLMDDEIASKTARMLGLNVRAASYLPIYWTRGGIVQAIEATSMLDELVREGYRLSTKDYIAIKEHILTKVSR